MAHSWPWSQGMAQEEDDPQDSRDMALHTPGWGNEAWPPAWLPAPIRPMRGSVGRFSAAAVSSREECNNAQDFFGDLPVSDRVGHDKTGVGYKDPSPTTNRSLALPSSSSTFPVDLQSTYDIVVGRKCRLHRSQPALFWFHSRQFFGRPSSRSSLLWHLAPNCKSTGHVHLRGSRPGWVMHGCPSWTDRDKVSQPYISDLGWIDGATLQGFGQTRWSHPFISLPVCGGAMGQWSERWSYISSRPQFLPGYHSARPQRREAFRRVVQACIKDTILVGAPRQTSCRCRRLQLRTPGYSWCSGLCYRAVRGSELRGSTWWSQRGDLLRAAEFRKAASAARRSEKRGGGALDKWGVETFRQRCWFTLSPHSWTFPSGAAWGWLA